MYEIYDLAARLKVARKAAGYKTSKAFITAHHIPASTYSQHETGKRTPNNEALLHYSKLLDVNIIWLKTGHGEPYPLHKQSSKKRMLYKEMLNITDSSFNKIITDSINEKLLCKILEKILKIANDKKFSIESTASAVAGIYADIISIESSPELQLKMVESASQTFKRYAK